MNRELLAAAESGDAKLCDAFLKNGANVNVKDKNGRRKTPLINAIKSLEFAARCEPNRNKCFYRILEEKKVDLNLADEHGEAALIYTTMYGDEKMCDALLKKGANVNSKTKVGVTPLMRSVMWKNQECFDRILKEKEVNVHLVTIAGETALHYAAYMYGDGKMCAALLKKGANVNAKDTCDGDTPLTAAVRYGTKRLKMVSEKTADLRGALEIANKKGLLEVTEILKWSQKLHLLRIRKCTQNEAKFWSVKM